MTAIRRKSWEGLACLVMLPSKVEEMRDQAKRLDSIAEEIDKGIEYAESIRDDCLVESLCKSRYRIDEASIKLRVQANILEAALLGLEVESLSN